MQPVLDPATQTLYIPVESPPTPSPSPRLPSPERPASSWAAASLSLSTSPSSTDHDAIRELIKSPTPPPPSSPHPPQSEAGLIDSAKASIAHVDSALVARTADAALVPTLPAGPSHVRLAHLTALLQSCTPSELLHASALIPSLLGAHDASARRAHLAAVLSACTPQELQYVASAIAPLLRRDVFASLPVELGLHVVSFVRDVRTALSLGMVNHAWRAICRDEGMWRMMCFEYRFLGGVEEWVQEGGRGGRKKRHKCRRREESSVAVMNAGDGAKWIYADDRRASEHRAQLCDSRRHAEEASPGQNDEDDDQEPLEEMERFAEFPMDPALEWLTARNRKARKERATSSSSCTTTCSSSSGSGDGPSSNSTSSRRSNKTFLTSYRAYFKQSYITMMNWRRGGHLMRTHFLPALSTAPPQHPARETPPPGSSRGTPEPRSKSKKSRTQQSQTQASTSSASAPSASAAASAPPDHGIVTSLALDADWIVVGLASSKIHVFSANTGVLARTLVGHESGVWGVCLVSRTSTSARRGRSGEKKERSDASADFDIVGGLHFEREEQRHAAAAGPDTSTSMDPTGEGEVEFMAKKLSKGKEKAEPTGRSETIKKSKEKQKIEKRRVERKAAEVENSAANMPKGRPLDYLVPPSLRVALGLPGIVKREKWKQKVGVGGGSEQDRDVAGPSGVDLETDDGRPWSSESSSEDDDGGEWSSSSGDESERNPTWFAPTGAYIPEKLSDPCQSSGGWGNPNALVVSGGCDKVIKVWDVVTGHCIYTLAGHTSTIRCMRMLHGRPIAVTGSRDATLRVWDVQRGILLRVLAEHEMSVRCLDVNGRRCVSGSYDATCRLWDIDTGQCLHVFRGHRSQIYSVAFDGIRIVSGGLDTTVRIWDPETGHCIALLQGHTALVCQLQLSPSQSLLATGGSDGRVITFSLQTYEALHKLAAHDSSVTAMQFDGRWLVTGGNDGRVRLWEVESGAYVRELCEPGESVWKVGFVGVEKRGGLLVGDGRSSGAYGEGEEAVKGDGGGAPTCAILGKRAGKTYMEIWNFRPLNGQ